MKFHKILFVSICSVVLFMGINACGTKQIHTNQNQGSSPTSTDNKSGKQQSATNKGSSQNNADTKSQLPQSTSNDENKVKKNSSSSQSQVNQKNSNIILENMEFGTDYLNLILTHGNMQTVYKNPHIESSDTIKKFIVTLNNVSQGKFSLNKNISINKPWAKSLTLTRSGSDLILTCILTSEVKSFQTGIAGGSEISFTFK